MISVDSIEAAILRSGIPRSFETGLAAYNVGAAVGEDQLRFGLTVIADAANYLEVGRSIWRSAADRARAEWRVIEVVCSDETTHRQRLRARQRHLELFPEPSWDDIVQRRAEAEPWDTDHLVLDSIRPIHDNVARALDYLTA